MLPFHDISKNDNRLTQGEIFRCSAQQLKDNLPSVVKKFKTILDLRVLEERRIFDYVSDLPKHIVYLNIPIEIETFKLKYPGTPMESVYRSFVLDTLSTLCSIVEQIICLPKPVLVHCRHGIDRTGVVCTLLLLILGASKKVIFDEYMISNANVVDTHLKIFLDLLASRDDLQSYFSFDLLKSLNQQMLNAEFQ